MNHYGKDVKTIWKDTKRIFGLPISFTHYSLITKPGKWTKIVRKMGLLHTEIEEIMVYRIDDVGIFQPLTGKLLGVGNVEISSEDDSCPNLVLRKIKNPHKVYNLISETVESERALHNVRFSEIGR